MGKYIKKGKIAGEVSVMELSHQSSVGVRTRARTLALQRLQRSSSPTPSPSPAVENDNLFYLQLRNRRLEKASVVSPRTKERERLKNGCNPCNAGKTSPNPVSSSSGLLLKEANGSSGENAVEFDSDNGGARETTPCSSFVRDSDAASTPDRTARRVPAPSSRHRDSQLDEFFAAAEQLQRKFFIDKYNFDPVNDCPLPGRYEWVRLDP